MTDQEKIAALEAKLSEANQAITGRTVSCGNCNKMANELSAALEVAARMREALEKIGSYFDTESEQDCPSGCKVPEDRRTSCEYQSILEKRMGYAKEALALPLPSLRVTIAKEAVAQAAKNLCPSEPASNDIRIDWLEVQIGREELAEFRKAVLELEAAEAEGEK